MSNADRPAENSGDESGAAEKRARTFLMLAAASSAIGVAIAGTVSRTTGGVILVASWVALVYAIHAFGRAGSSR